MRDEQRFLVTIAIATTLVWFLLIGWLIGHECHSGHKSALQSVYEGYNHIQMYEDGSYIAQDRDGQQEWGCILTAQCNN